jgi:hypothetical protein
MEMVAKLQRGVLPFKIEGTEETLIARAGLVLPNEMAKVLKRSDVIERALSQPGRAHD